MEERQELVRSLVKAVVHCDLTQDPPIERGYDREYDVVISSMCLEAVAQTPEEYKNGVDKLAKFVKPGGLLLLLGLELVSGLAAYGVGDHDQKFKCFGITPELAGEAMTEAGMSDITIKKLNDVPSRAESMWTYIFSRRRKTDTRQ